MSETTEQQQRALERLVTLAERFASLLGEEAEALRAREPAAIERIAADKLALAKTLEGATAALAAAGLRPDGASRERAASSPALRGAWERLLACTAACLERNLANGIAIELARAFNASLLSVLRGEPPHSGLYDSNGRLDETSSARTLANA